MFYTALEHPWEDPQGTHKAVAFEEKRGTRGWCWGKWQMEKRVVKGERGDYFQPSKLGAFLRFCAFWYWCSCYLFKINNK